jgi:hypothetical protein
MAPGDPTSRPRRCAASEDAKNAMAPHFSAKAFLDSKRLMATTWESWESWTGPVVDLRTDELLIELCTYMTYIFIYIYILYVKHK